MSTYAGPDDATIREMAIRAGGGHPLSEIRAEEHVEIANTPVVEAEPELAQAAPEEAVAGPDGEQTDEEGDKPEELENPQTEQEKPDGND